MTARQQLRNRNTGKPGNGGHFDGFTPAADEGITLQTYEVIDDDVDVFFDSPVEFEATPDVVTFEMGEENLVRDTNRIVGQEVARLGMKYELVDEVAGEVLADVYAQAASKRAKGTVTNIHGGLIRTIARTKIASAVDNHRRHEDSRGLRDWKARVTELEAELGRSLTGAEGDALADEIRANWHAPNHRPSKGFHKQTRFESIDVTAEEGRVAPQLVAPEAVEVEGGERAHRLADLLDTKDLTKVQARRQLWNVFAAEDGAPEALPGWMTSHAVRSAKQQVKDAVSVATKWQDGLTTDEETKALFAPFGELTRGEQQSITDTILARPAYGHRMWVAAVDFASSTDGYLV